MTLKDALQRIQAEQAQAEAAQADASKNIGSKAAGVEVYGWDMTEVPDAASNRRPAPRAADADAEHDSLMEECARVDMLELARRDTGETGKAGGGYVAFKTCPLCGHKDCFRVYPQTNTCACFGGSNGDRKAGRQAAGGSVLDYLQARHGGNITEAVKELHALSGTPFDPKRASRNAEQAQGDQGGQSEGVTLKLPPWGAVKAADPPKRNPTLIDGVVRRGHVALLSGKGKVGKSWDGIGLCVAVAAGLPQWNGLPLRDSGACLYIDPELDHKSLDNRFHAVCAALGVDAATVDARVSKWCLRGVPDASMGNIIHDLQARGEESRFALVVLDSASCFVEGDENASGDVRKFAADVLRVAAITGATVLIIHHHGKARDGDREAADRARGSSVWLDFPDAVLTLTEVFPPSGEPSDYLADGEYACLLESGGIREYPRMEPIRLVFGYPVHRVDAEGVTDGWKPRSSARDGGKKTGEGNKAKSAERAQKCVTALLAEFVARGSAEGIPASEAAEVVSAAIGETVKAQTLKGYLEGSDVLEAEQVSKQRWQVVPKRKPPKPDPHLEL